jgi:hypothetical protein
MNEKELKKYFVDICARVAQVIFTLLVVTPFITSIFNWNLVIAGTLFFVFIVGVGAVISFSIKEVS